MSNERVRISFKTGTMSGYNNNSYVQGALYFLEDTSVNPPRYRIFLNGKEYSASHDASSTFTTSPITISHDVGGYSRNTNQPVVIPSGTSIEEIISTIFSGQISSNIFSVENRRITLVNDPSYSKDAANKQYVDGKVSAVADDLSDLTSEFSSFKSDTEETLGSIELSVGDLEELVSELSSRVGTLESSVGSISSRVSDLETNATETGESISGLISRVVDLEDNQSAIGGTLNWMSIS